MVLVVKWIDHGREPRCAPDPAFPMGIDLDMSEPGRAACETALPWPARRCGLYVVTCDVCGLCTVVTTAGRPDDPRRLKAACKRATEMFCQGCGVHIRAGRTYCARCTLRHRIAAAIKAARTRQKTRKEK